MIYLASPYSDPDPEVEQARYLAARDFCARQMTLHNRAIISPIVYGRQFQLAYAMSGSAAAWTYFNNTLLRTCDQLWVLKLSGWRKSKGVTHEIDRAKHLGLPLSWHEGSITNG